MRESMCDRCMSPGHCCKGVALHGGGQRNRPFERAIREISEPMSFERAEHLAMQLGISMFRPAFQEPNGSWRWWCTALDRDGRCSIYEDRPQLCRDYRPGQDGLCVHFWDPDSPLGELIKEVEALEREAVAR